MKITHVFTNLHMNLNSYIYCMFQVMVHTQLNTLHPIALRHTTFVGKHLQPLYGSLRSGWTMDGHNVNAMMNIIRL